MADGRPRRWTGRPSAEVVDPDLVPALEELIDPETRGDPESAFRWTTKSTVRLADELTKAGHRVGALTVGRLLKRAGYSLQGNAKTVEGNQHPDRDAQLGGRWGVRQRSSQRVPGDRRSGDVDGA
jgi:hypothetical protein